MVGDLEVSTPRQIKQIKWNIPKNLWIPLKTHIIAGLCLVKIALVWNAGLCYWKYLQLKQHKDRETFCSTIWAIEVPGSRSIGSPAWSCRGGGSSSKVIWSTAQVLPVSVHQHSPGGLCQMSIRTLICAWRSTPTHLWETHVCHAIMSFSYSLTVALCPTQRSADIFNKAPSR